MPLSLSVIAMEIEIQKITDEFGKLKSVYSYVFQFKDEAEMKAVIHLKFESGDVFHEAKPDTDEISCSSSLMDKYQASINISSELPWKNVIGKGVRWIWNLKNQQGYNDAIQYAFANPEENETLIQLIVEASEIKTYGISEKL